jgi:hypothetical protein
VRTGTGKPYHPDAIKGWMEAAGLKVVINTHVGGERFGVMFGSKPQEQNSQRVMSMVKSLASRTEY